MLSQEPSDTFNESNICVVYKCTGIFAKNLFYDALFSEKSYKNNFPKFWNEETK